MQLKVWSMCFGLLSLEMLLVPATECVSDPESDVEPPDAASCTACIALLVGIWAGTCTP